MSERIPQQLEHAYLRQTLMTPPQTNLIADEISDFASIFVRF
jgi:hypothetical protein